MNELQWILLGFAVVVIAVLWGVNALKKRKLVSKAPVSEDASAQEAAQDTAQDTAQDKGQAASALNELGEPHIPVSENTQARLHTQPQTDPDANPNAQSQSASSPKKHRVIEDDEMRAIQEVGPRMGVADDKPNFGIPQPSEPQTQQTHASAEAKMDEVLQSSSDTQATRVQKAHDAPSAQTQTDTSTGQPETQTKTASDEPNKESKVFALIVMGTEDFAWPSVNQTLQGVGLTPNDKGIFVKKDTMGNEIIRVASLLEPGTFPIEDPSNDTYTTAGVVLILALPCTVKAPAAMHDMIMMARKISQRLNGRLYDDQRHLIKESDLQAMRDVALAYETSAVQPS